MVTKETQKPDWSLQICIKYTSGTVQRRSGLSCSWRCPCRFLAKVRHHHVTHLVEKLEHHGSVDVLLGDSCQPDVGAFDMEVGGVQAMLVTGEQTCCREWMTLTRKASTAFLLEKKTRQRTWSLSGWSGSLGFGSWIACSRKSCVGNWSCSNRLKTKKRAGSRFNQFLNLSVHLLFPSAQ